MSNSGSNYVEEKTLQFWLRANADTISAPSTVYVGLHTGDPGEDGTANELVGNGYSRTAGSFGNVSVIGDVVSITNNAAIDFGPATASWGSVTHMSIWDSASGSTNCLFKGALSAAKTVDTNDSFRFANGNLTVTMD